MIKIENVMVTGWEAAIRGARNPMNSWENSDTMFLNYAEDDCVVVCHDILGNEHRVIPEDWSDELYDGVKIGPNDLKLLTNLAKAGSDEAKFRRMIVVYLDVTAPMYWWKEADTYKVGTVRNSCSTMHKIHGKEFTPDDFSTEHLVEASMCELENTAFSLNNLRSWYCKYDDLDDDAKAALEKTDNIKCKKDLWWNMIQLLPSSYNQRATLMLNYEVLANMYHARKNHKLDEWREFCAWIETLPYAKELIIGEESSDDISETRKQLSECRKEIERLTDVIVVNLGATGEDIEIIAGITNLSESTVINILRKYGVKEPKTMAKELYKNGMSIKDISDKMSVAESTIEYFVSDDMGRF